MGTRTPVLLWFLLGVTITLSIVLGVMVLTDDGGAPGATVAPDPTDATIPTSEAPATTAVTTIPTSTSGPASTTVPPAGSRCAGLESMTLPAGVEVVGGPGNFDGLPEPESIMDADSAYVFQSDGAWYVGFSLDIGYRVFQPLPPASMPGFTPEIVVWDFAGDDGALVKVDASLMSGAEVYVWYFLDEDCVIEDAGTTDQDPLQFLDWFGASHTEAFACASDGVFHTSAGEGSGGMWDVRDVFYRWTAPSGPGFEFGFEDGTEVPTGDPLIAEAGTVRC